MKKPLTPQEALEAAQARIIAKCTHPQRFYNYLDKTYKVPSPKELTVWDITVMPSYAVKHSVYQGLFASTRWATYWHDVNFVGLQDEPHSLITWCLEEERLHMLGVFPDLICQEVKIGDGVVAIGETYHLTLEDIELHQVKMTYTRVEVSVIRIISNWLSFVSKNIGYQPSQTFKRHRLKLRKKIRYQKYKDMMGLRTKDLVSIATKGKPNDT